jgi:hypothetical protein
LKLGQASQVIATPLGYFILRLRRIESPVYFAFGDVQYKIKSSLVSQKTEQTKQRDKREVQIFITQIEEDALERAYHNAYMMNIDKVSDREAEEWWLNNKNNFLSAFGIQQEGFELPTDGKTTNFKKRNLLLKEYKDIIKDQYVRKNVMIYEKFLY